MGEAFVWRSPAGNWLGMNQSAPRGQPQRVERYAGLTLPPQIELTHVTVPRFSQESQDLIVGRPAPLWGVSMGVNYGGVAGSVIRAGKPGRLERFSPLLKEDLLRLALMQAHSAKAAVGVVTAYLERFGEIRGRTVAPAVYVFADAGSLWLLETEGNLWWAQPVGHMEAVVGAPAWPGDAVLKALNARPENRRPKLALETDARRATLLKGLAHVINHHETGHFTPVADILRGDVMGHWEQQEGAVCRHGRLWQRETANSMLVHLEVGKAPRLWFTGSSRPCISLFKPVQWDAEPWFHRHVHFWENWRHAIRLAQRWPAVRERLITLHRELENQWQNLLQEDVNVLIRLEQWWNAVNQVLKMAR
ncbi:MAG: hypothetical protein D6758_00775 [Gammaproteobacteria bacterium]|nr:MAG: hypothetical protein D6758_00775 [Gammaproteobacteria bacterium]